MTISTKARDELHAAIKDMNTFVSHNVGHLSGSTTSSERLLLQTAETAGRLRESLMSGVNLPDRLDEFEATFQTMAAVSGGVAQSTHISRISDGEIEIMLKLIDAVRDDIGDN